MELLQNVFYGSLQRSPHKMFLHFRENIGYMVHLHKMFFNILGNCDNMG